MMQVGIVIAFLVMALLVIAEGIVAFALLNRVLTQAGQRPIELPRPEPETPEIPKPRKLFGVSIKG